MRVIAFTNQKGGVGKTTSTSAVGASLAAKGFKVLMLDLDPQANLTDSLGITDPTTTITGILFKQQDPAPYSIAENLYLIAGSSATAAFENNARQGEFLGLENYILKNYFDSLELDYDFILIDCPPAIGLIIVNIYLFATELFVPLDIDINAISGLQMVLATAKRLQPLNPELKVMGVFLTKYEDRTLVSRHLYSHLKEEFNCFLLRSKIRSNGVAVKESALLYKRILDHAPESNSAKDYAALTEEILTLKLQ